MENMTVSVRKLLEGCSILYPGTYANCRALF